MFCKHCGQQLPEGSLFCTNCGKQVGGEPSVQQQAPASAASANRAAVPDSTPTPAEAAPATAAAGGISTNTIIAAVAIIAVAAVIAAGIVNGWFGGSGANTTGAGNQAVEEAAGAEAGQAGATDASATAATYSYNTMLLDGHGGENGSNFNYVEISSSDGETEVLAELNRTLREQAEHAYEYQATPEVMASRDEATIRNIYYSTFSENVTFLQDGIVCIAIRYYQITPGAAHGAGFTEAIIRDLATGEDIDPAAYLGISHETRDDYTFGAIDGFLSTAGDNYSSADEVTQYQSIGEMADNGQIAYLLGDDGLYAWCQAYVLGSYAFGEHTLRVCDAYGNALERGIEVHLW